MDMLKVGDDVMWRGAWGSKPAVKAKVVGIEVTEIPHSKHGKEVKEVPWCVVNMDCAVISLDNNHWCYGKQISPLSVSADTNDRYSYKFQCGIFLCSAVRDFLKETKFKYGNVDFIESSGIFTRTFTVKANLQMMKYIKESLIKWGNENGLIQ